MIIKTIDLWTEQRDNHYECFNGAFVDGFENNNIPFNNYKIFKNCNCIITTSDKDIKVKNKQHAIVFYNYDKPVRLLVINKNTDIEKCVEVALKQNFNGKSLKELYLKENIIYQIIDKQEQPIDNDVTGEEIDVSSCDRFSLLYNMLKGSYTEDESVYGNFTDDKYLFLPNIKIEYQLILDTIEFRISHSCAFINEIKTRIIPIQDNSSLARK